MSEVLTTMPALSKDLRQAAKTLSIPEARVLVDLYYQVQDFRIQASNQVYAMTKTEEPHATVGHFHGQFKFLELDIAKALDTYSASQPLGVWVREHVGIGPVIAAGLLAHIPIDKTPTPSALWKFAGMMPGQKYVKGEKRSWNAGLKLLCWKIGDSFVKQSGREKCYYGHLYVARKHIEVSRNESGACAEAAARQLEEKNIKDPALKKRLLEGKLPDGQVDMRARRYAVKRFLMHYWQAAYVLEYNAPPPRAYVHEYLGHQHVEHNPFVPVPVPVLQP